MKRFTLHGNFPLGSGLNPLLDRNDVRCVCRFPHHDSVQVVLGLGLARHHLHGDRLGTEERLRVSEEKHGNPDVGSCPGTGTPKVVPCIPITSARVFPPYVTVCRVRSSNLEFDSDRQRGCISARYQAPLIRTSPAKGANCAAGRSLRTKRISRCRNESVRPSMMTAGPTSMRQCGVKK